MYLHDTFLSVSAFLSNLHFSLKCLKMKLEMRKNQGTQGQIIY